MFQVPVLFLVLTLYLLLLFTVAWHAERRERAGRSIVNNPYIYSLSLAVYCTSWTFYGSVGRAATSGLSFLAIYLGPTLMAALWAVVLRKIVRIAKANRITTISDFLGFRYGKSLLLAGLVAAVAVVGTTPYLGLQIKAIISTVEIVTREAGSGAAMGLIITGTLAVFAVIFGARRLDSSERHVGLVFAVAFESIVKLLAFVLVGVFVTFGLFDGPGDIFGRIAASPWAARLTLGGGAGTGYAEWAALLALSMVAILFLPRQFQMAVVENHDEAHIAKAAWLFPSYLFLINLFVLPIAFAGLLLTGSERGADYFVLTLPLSHGMQHLSLLVFLGGFSAATSMVIVESVALATMAMNSIVMPTLIRFHDRPRFPALILNIKRLVICAVVLLGYLFAVSIGEFYSLVDIGLKSFEAVALFAPAFLLGLVWKRGTSRGAIAGLVGGFVVWFYTLIIPALLKAGLIAPGGVVGRLVTSELLNPGSLFGIQSLGKWGNSLFWSTLVNLGLYLVVSLLSRQSREEEVQGMLFVESDGRTRELPHGASFTPADVEGILAQYVGAGEAREFVRGFLARRPSPQRELSAPELSALRLEAETVLSGAIGSSLSAIIFEDKLVLSEKERAELSASLKQLTESLRLSRQELAETNIALNSLREFSANIVESVPLGISTVDASLRVNFWNREMEALTGARREDALGRGIGSLLPWLPAGALPGGGRREELVQLPGQRCLRVRASPFKDPSGGHVVILEDVTDRKVMEEQLLQASKLASVGRITAGLSHEIGNPLAAVSSLVQELVVLPPQERLDSGFVREALRSIGGNLDRIGRIVRSLGDFARVSTADKTPTDVAEVFRRTVDLVRFDKRFRRIRLETEFEPLPPLLLSPDQMEQVFLNIMLNALDAVAEGGELRVAMRRVGREAAIEFRDNGPGMDPAVVERIFDPFFTTKPLGKGTGLGLSICYGIVRDHGGTIVVKSAPGAGTAFLIRLPIGD